MNDLRKIIIKNNKEEYKKINNNLLDKKINNELYNYIIKNYNSNSIICLYNKFGFEPDIEETIKKLLEHNYKICLPCIEEKNTLRFINDINYDYVMIKSIKQPSVKNTLHGTAKSI